MTRARSVHVEGCTFENFQDPFCKDAELQRVLAVIVRLRALAQRHAHVHDGGFSAGWCATYTQEPAGAVYANVSVSSAKRGSVFPPTLTFTPDDWNVPKVSPSPG